MLLAVLICVAVVLGMVIFLDSTNQIEGDHKRTEAPVTDTPAPVTPTATPVPTDTPSPTPEPTPTPIPQLLEGLVICIDAGHQRSQNKDTEPCAPWDSSLNSDYNNETMKKKVESGTQGQFTGIPEYQINLEISLKIRDTLKAYGATVVMVRETDDVDISNKERAEIGNQSNADLVLRIHCDGAGNESANGIGLWIRGNGDGTAEYKALGDYEYKVASELLNYLVAYTGANKRYVNKSDAYTGLNWSTVPSIIVECGFMSNEMEDRNLATDEYQQKIADGILNFFLKSKELIRK